MKESLKDKSDNSGKNNATEKKETKSNKPDKNLKPSRDKKFKPDHNLKPARVKIFKPDHNLKPARVKIFKPDHNIKPAREKKSKPNHDLKPPREKKFKPEHNIKPAQDKKFKPDPTFTPNKDTKNKTDDKLKIEKLKQAIKNLNWDKNAPDWTIIDRKSKKIIQLDPTQDCSQKNPLYKSEKWLKRVYNDEKLDLSDRKLAKICGLKSHRSLGAWREKFNIPTKEEKGRYIDDKGYVRLLMPSEYQHPELTPISSGRIIRKEHDVIMKNYLKEHPESELSKECLIDGKYLKTECEVHHINHVPDDNRLENLWLYRTKSEHSYAQRSLNDCFSGLHKLGQIHFDEGKYYINQNFDYKSLDASEIKKIIKPTEFKGDMSIDEIKSEVKTLDWDKNPNDWTVWKNSNQYEEVRMTVNPYQDCSKENPLYRNKFWVETIVREKRYNLTDPRLAKVCGTSERSAYRWRWEKHQIPTYYERWGKIRTIRRSETAGDRIWIKIPNDYKNPFATKLSRQDIMPEHRYVIENYLAKHPELEISQKSLLDGKYLKPEYIVHHINLDTLDNRRENLWVCERQEEHNSVHASLLDLVEPLIKSGLLSFKEGKYHLNYED